MRNWRGDGGRLAGEVLGRLVAGKSLDGLGLGRDDDRRWDLRGFTVPAPVVTGAVQGRWGKAKTLDGLAEFKKVTLGGLNLSGSMLMSLRMQRCLVADCRFDDAKFRDLRLWDTEVADSSFAGADLRDSLLGSWQGGRRNTWRNVSFARADLRGATVWGALFDGCDFSKARLDGLEFEQCDLRGCRFAGRMREVIFDCRPRPDRPTPAPLRDVDFSRASFEDVAFWDCHVDGVVLPDDPGIFLVPRYRDVAQRALTLLAGDTSQEARMLTGELRNVLRGPGDASGAGLFNRGDYVEAGGEALAQLAERVFARAAAP
jgi:uncharacterized protein YjbI with pentapeptide repeats